MGDSGVGKSSLVSSLAEERFDPTIVPGFSFPVKEFGANLTADHVHLEIVDTPSFDTDATSKNKAETEKQIRSADVILLIYDVSRPQTFERVSTFWLSWIQDTVKPRNLSVLLVGNKVDLTGDDPSEDRLQKYVMPIMNRFPEIETCVECSARTLMNLSDTFRFAQMAVLHPIKPIFDSRTHQLKPKCAQAFKRIFKIVDRDKDGFLSDKELNQFQFYCFGLPLSPEELAGVKEVVSHQQPDGIDAERGMSESGFVYLHMLFVQRGRMETTWSVLRKFGYTDENEEVEFMPSYLLPEQYATMTVPYELSNMALEYLTDIFKAYQTRAQAAGLTEKQLDELFSPAPNGNPWPASSWKTMTRTDSDLITLDSFLSMWHLMAAEDHRKAVKYLAYLGFDSTMSTPFKQFTTRRARYKRNVLHVAVIGAPGVGKTTLLSRAVGHPLPAPKAGDFLRVCTLVKDKSVAADHFVLLTEVPSKDAETIFSDTKHPLCTKTDLVLVLFDASSEPSVKFVEERAVKALMNSPFTVVFMGTHADRAAPAVVERVEKLAADLHLSQPKVLTTSAIDDSVFGDLIRANAASESHRIMSTEQRAKKRNDRFKRFSIAATACVAVTAAGVGAWYWLNRRGEQEQ